jgi:hypothetical protein
VSSSAISLLKKKWLSLVFHHSSQRTTLIVVFRVACILRNLESFLTPQVVFPSFEDIQAFECGSSGFQGELSQNYGLPLAVGHSVPS